MKGSVQKFSHSEIAGFFATYVTVAEGISLRVLVSDTEPQDRKIPLIMIPGLGSVPQNFSNLLGSLCNHFQVFLIETREKSSSQITGIHQFTIKDLADDLSKAIENLIPLQKPYAVLGYSMGGTVFLEAFHKLTEKPCCAILVSPSARFPFPSWIIPFSYLAVPFYPFVKPFLKAYISRKHVNTESDIEMHNIQKRVLDAADAGKMAKTVRQIMPYTVWHSLLDINIPVLLIAASKDTFHNKEDMHLLAQRIPSSSITDLETNERTHGKEAAEIIVKFIKESGKR